jgi:hypothetical protein
MKADSVQVFAPMTRLACKNAGISRNNDIILHADFFLVKEMFS